MKIAAQTDKGLVREFNEDSFATGRFGDDIGWAVVCDGMGGRNGGSVASKKAVELISESLKNGASENMTNNNVRYLLESAIVTANSIIFEMANGKDELNGMGTTVLVAFVNKNTVHIAHAGDSRAYLLRQGELYRLTVDHSVVQTMVDSGQLTEDEAKNHPRKNIITRALGAEKDIAIDLNEVCLQSEDILLLCTDGITNFVESDQIIKVLGIGVIEKAPAKLIEIANKAGGGDNITAVAMLI